MNWRASRVFCLFSFILLLTTGCSSLNFIASGKTPFKIVATGNADQKIAIEGTEDFYFWGRLPKNMEIDLEDESNRLGLYRPSHVSVEQSIGWKSLFYSIITLGFYCPVDYKIVVLNSKDDRE
ncbi:MAG: hypothetical protein EHM20_05610 [Alphaproteobacteria bacterium]|nr:MAG: hypothetical protein EHM20_05610 [Alphaproteobacteria bacterium]